MQCVCGADLDSSKRRDDFACWISIIVSLQQSTLSCDVLIWGSAHVAGQTCLRRPKAAELGQTITSKYSVV